MARHSVSPHWGPIWSASTSQSRRESGGSGNIGEFMRRRVLQSRVQVLRHLAVSASSCCSASGGAFAQSGDNHASDQQAKPPPQSGRRRQGQPAQDRRIRRGRAGHQRPGRQPGMRLARPPRGQPDVGDDLDTAFRHLDLYDRFGCPGGHVQAAFRCLTRFGGQIDDKVPRQPERPRPRLLDQSRRPAAARRQPPRLPAAAGSLGLAPPPQPAPPPAPRRLAARLRRNSTSAAGRNVQVRSGASTVERP